MSEGNTIFAQYGLRELRKITESKMALNYQDICERILEPDMNVEKLFSLTRGDDLNAL